jgi:GNAT superfamily N-acetyltransferase
MSARARQVVPFEIRILRDAPSKELLSGQPHVTTGFAYFNPKSLADRTFIAALDAGVVVGLVSLLESSFKIQNALAVAYVATHREHQRRGVAGQLVTALFEFAQGQHKHIANSFYGAEGRLWLMPLMSAAALRYPDVALHEHSF